MGSTAEMHLFFTRERHARWAKHVAEDLLKLLYAPAGLPWVQEADEVTPLCLRYLLFRDEAAKLDLGEECRCYALSGLSRKRTEVVIGSCADLAGWTDVNDPEELFPQLCYACALQYPHVPFAGLFRYEMTVSGAIQLLRVQYDGKYMHIQERSGMMPMDEDDWSNATVRHYTVKDWMHTGE